jgi:hypothetical protein
MSKHKAAADWDNDPKQDPKHDPKHEPKYEPEPTADPKQLVRVRCITDARPFTGTKALGLENGEEADVPADVAKVLVERKHVEYVK